jgi:hypothetical protein
MLIILGKPITIKLLEIKNGNISYLMEINFNIWK